MYSKNLFADKIMLFFLIAYCIYLSWVIYNPEFISNIANGCCWGIAVSSCFYIREVADEYARKQ